MTFKYALALDQAVAELLKLDPAEVARLAGGSYDPETRAVTIRYCGRPVGCRFADGALTWSDTGEAFDPVASIPLLHYLVNARGGQPTGELLPYRELWGAKTQSGPFVDRPSAALAEEYGRAPEAVLARARAMGAEIIEKFGDVRLDIRVFPNLPVAVLLYAADEEMPAGVTFLFDAVIREYLHTEDTAWVAEMLAERLSAE